MRFVLGIYVECRGVARVDFAKQEPKWRTIRRRGRSSHRELSYVTVHHKSFEEYFYQRVILKDGGTKQMNIKKKQKITFEILERKRKLGAE